MSLHDPSTIRPLAPTLWVSEHPLRVAGLELGRRMTIVRLPGGGLWLHSVAHLTPERRSAIDEFGTVRFVVAPNPFHHQYLEAYREAYPEAVFAAGPRLPEKRPDLSFDLVLADHPDPRWESELDQLVFAGNPLLPEVVFHHRPSRTLILTDLCFHLNADRPLLTRLAARVLGTYEKFAVSRLVRRGFSERDAARASLARVMAWDFDRVIVGHGDIIEHDGREALARAFDWLRSA